MKKKLLIIGAVVAAVSYCQSLLGGHIVWAHNETHLAWSISRVEVIKSCQNFLEAQTKVLTSIQDNLIQMIEFRMLFSDITATPERKDKYNKQYRQLYSQLIALTAETHNGIHLFGFGTEGPARPLISEEGDLSIPINPIDLADILSNITPTLGEYADIAILYKLENRTTVVRTANFAQLAQLQAIVDLLEKFQTLHRDIDKITLSPKSHCAPVEEMDKLFDELAEKCFYRAREYVLQTAYSILMAIDKLSTRDKGPCTEIQKSSYNTEFFYLRNCLLLLGQFKFLGVDLFSPESKGQLATSQRELSPCDFYPIFNSIDVSQLSELNQESIRNGFASLFKVSESYSLRDLSEGARKPLL